MICPDCGAENPDGTPFCGLCSRPFNYIDDGTGHAYPDWCRPGETAMAYSPPGESMGMRLNIGKILYILFVCIVIIAVIGGTAFLARWFLTGNKTYSSGVSSLTFKYPRTWHRLSSEDVQCNEIGLEANDKNYYCFVESVNGLLPPNQDLKLFLARWKIEILPDITDNLFPGMTFTNSTYSDVLIEGNYPGVHITGILYEGAAHAANCEILLTTDGSSAYVMILASEPEHQTDEIFKEIISSIKFDGEESASGTATPKIVE
ncbi:MAG: zinc ribbon domain-containing protein [Actinobacteria bacterium]|nr:zinc ribbon domain-containing protein [Actinomycetota bacterium]